MSNWPGNFPRNTFKQALARGERQVGLCRVEGPVMMFLTTTAIDLDEELLNRCLVLSVNEDREQTQAIHGCSAEQQTLEGLLNRQQRRES